MKRLLIFFLLTPVFSLAQDILTLKNGEVIKIKTLEILPDMIKYKNWDNLEGPIRSEYTYNVVSIKYKNGTIEKFTQNTTKTSTQTNVSNSKIENDKLLAIEKSKNYFISQIGKHPELKFIEFEKINGKLNNLFGLEVYEIQFKLKISFIKEGWIVGNMVEGYFNNGFKVHPKEVKIGFSPNSKFFEVGTLLELNGNVTMENSDNGYVLKDFKIGKIVSLNNNNQLQTQNSNQKSVNNENSTSPSNSLSKEEESLFNEKINKFYSKLDLQKLGKVVNINSIENVPLERFIQKFIKKGICKKNLTINKTENGDDILKGEYKDCLGTITNNSYMYYKGLLFDWSQKYQILEIIFPTDNGIKCNTYDALQNFKLIETKNYILE